MAERTTFLNVDLDIASREDLAPLVEALAPRLFALHVERIGRQHRARLELSREPRTPDVAIRALSDAVEALPARHRARWKRATTRELNIGIQAADGPPDVTFPIEAASIAKIAKIGGRLAITVYGSKLTRR